MRKINLSKFHIILSLVILALIIYGLFLCANSVLHHDIGFNTDIARDFLLLENVTQTHKLPLIGPRSGGIPGIFHGPLWLYLNLPVYIIGGQNPVAIGWFWIGLIAVLGAGVYAVGKKVYGHTVGLLAALLVIIVSVPSASSLFNPFGAVLFAPIFFYLFYLFYQKEKYIYLLCSLLIAGVLIQFQIAFGAPILVLASLIIFAKIIKSKKWRYFSAYLVLLIPFSTYIMFDVRHQFLELHALFDYVAGSSVHLKGFTLISMLQNRIDGISNSLVGLQYPTLLLTVAILSYFAYLLYKSVRTRHTNQAVFCLLYFYFFFGYWLSTLLFRGVVWSYYYWPFIPMSLLLISAGWKTINKFIFVIFFIAVFSSGLNYAQGYASSQISGFIGKDTGSWVFNYQVAKTVFNMGSKSFGYYIFSPDEFGYSPRFAMDYVGLRYPNVKVSPYTKQQVTYLEIEPAGGKNNSIGGGWWRVHRVRITGSADKTISFSNGFKIEKYSLTSEQMQVPSDPNLVNSLFFR